MTEEELFVSLVYMARISAGMPVSREPGKIGRVQWFSPDAVPEQLTRAAVDALAACTNWR